jgi:hypothetical protein
VGGIEVYVDVGTVVGVLVSIGPSGVLVTVGVLVGGTGVGVCVSCRVKLGVSVIVGVELGIAVLVTVGGIGVLVMVGVCVAVGIGEGMVMSGGRPNIRVTRNCSRIPVRSVCKCAVGLMDEMMGKINGCSKVIATITRVVPKIGSPGSSAGVPVSPLIQES